MEIKRLKLIDKSFIFILLLIIVFGLVILTSATNSLNSDPHYYIKKQLLNVAIGIILTTMVVFFDYVQFRRYSNSIYIVSLLLLLAILIFGEEAKGSARAISIAGLPSIQPAEFAKVFIIIAFADFLVKRQDELKTLKQLLPCFIYMSVPILLILLQPDLGTGMVFIAIMIVMLYVAGADARLLTRLIAAGVLIIGILLFLHIQFGMWLPLEEYQIKRLTVFANPYEDGQGGRGLGWNTIQSLVAIGSGGLGGKGLFAGTQVQLNFLPEHHTDFIYAVIGEELGFIGAALLIVLFGLLLFRTVYISYNAKDLYGVLVVMGILAMWLFHIFENIGMSIGLMPITGIPLPFISYGGSSMMANLMAAGLVLSINIRGKGLIF
ncbi:MAG: rod shape-determining protein RodA [Syntrophomonadaceae bacterium]|nr:rod shape-determining protein RodA [Syntrophomonadaceae bacterium]